MDSLLLLHGADKPSDEWFLVLYDMAELRISIWKQECLNFGWNVRNSSVNYLLQ